jgi:TPR repeat protein
VIYVRKFLPIMLLFCCILQSYAIKAEELGIFGARIFMFQEKLAKKGNVRAQYKLGTLYEFGVSVKPNIEQARHWYQLASKKDYLPAINRYTYLEVRASGFVPEKHNQWLSGLIQQADTAEANALILLGQMHRHGIGVAKDLQKSLALLSRASSLGHTEIDAEIDEISREIEKRDAVSIENKKRKALINKKKKAVALKKRNEEKRKKNQEKKKQKAADEKLRRYEEAMRKLREEELLLEQQQKWAESQ